MAGKSIDDILRQQAAQRQAQIQAQQAQERAVNEQRERQRQDYLQRMRMFEALNTISPAAAASAAGGSGQVNQEIPTINGHAELILFSTDDLDNWQYVILDFLAETISDIKDTGVAKTEGTNRNIIENTGFAIGFDNSVLFINDNAEIIESVSGSVVASRNKRNYYYALFDNGTLYQFDGKVVTSYTGIPVGSDYTQLDSTKNSLVITTVESNTDQDANVYVWNPTIGLSSVLWSGVNREAGLTNRLNGIVSNNNTEFFSVSEYDDDADGWKTIHMFGDDGTIKTNLDVTSFDSNLSYGVVNLISDSTLEFFVHRAAVPQNSTYYFNIYDNNTDTWRKSTHTKTNYSVFSDSYYQNHYDGSQYTSLSNGSFRLLNNAGGSTSSVYNIDIYRYLDVVWSIDGSTFSSYTVNNTGVNNKGIDINDANRDGLSNNMLYIGKSFFLPLWLNDSKISLLYLTSTQSSVIDAGSTTDLTGTQGDATKIPGWNDGQKYVSFRVGDNFGIWLSYASGDVYKIYNEFGNNLISLTMSTNTVLRYSGDLAVISDNTDGIEYVFTSDSLGASPSATYSTYSTLSDINYYGLGSAGAYNRYHDIFDSNLSPIDVYKTYTDDEITPSRMLNLNEGGMSRIFTTEGVFDFSTEEYIFNKWTSDEYIVLQGQDTSNYSLFFYDWSGNLLASIDTGVSKQLGYDATLVKDRVYFRVVDGTTTTYYYFSPTKSDSVSIENESDFSANYDYWPRWVN